MQSLADKPDGGNGTTKRMLERTGGDDEPHINRPTCTVETATALRKRFDRVRSRTLGLVAGLSNAKVRAGSMPDASPMQWHLAHTTWFFETFVLRDFVRNYRPFTPHFSFLYSSYYATEGGDIARLSRGLLPRPSLGEVLGYRIHVDAAVRLALDNLPAPAREQVVIGCDREKQHQKLLRPDVHSPTGSKPLAPREPRGRLIFTSSLPTCGAVQRG